MSFIFLETSTCYVFNPREKRIDNSRVNSYKLNPVLSGEVSELVEGARLETVCGVMRHRGFESLPLRHSWKVTGSVMQGGPLLPSTPLEFAPVL